jgi:hypothetical protein
MLLGDRVEQALGILGITKDRVETWLQRPCKCDVRKYRLNSIDHWARRVTAGHVARAKEYLEQILEDRL